MLINISDYCKSDSFFGRLHRNWEADMCMSALLLHTHTHTPFCSKTDFSHFMMASAPLLHRLQFSDLIGPTNWPSAHLTLTRNWPITVFKAAHNSEPRSGPKPTNRSISVSHSPGQCISQPSETQIHIDAATEIQTLILYKTVSDLILCSHTK